MGGREGERENVRGENGEREERRKMKGWEVHTEFVWKLLKWEERIQGYRILEGQIYTKELQLHLQNAYVDHDPI